MPPDLLTPAHDPVEALTGPRHVPDILECLANLSSDEVFTPPAVANRVLDLLPEHVWSEPTYRWLDPGSKSGVFLREAARRLLVGLAEVIPDEEERRRHINTRMLHGIAITELTALVSRRTLYCSKDAASEYSVTPMPTPDGLVHFARVEHTFAKGRCVVCGAPESLERGAGRENHAYQFIHTEHPLPEEFQMPFDVIVGNPPYQTDDGGHGASASPIYHLFVNQAKQLEPRYLSMIIPSRWFAGGKGLDDFRAAMLADRGITDLVDFPNAGDCFPGVEIKGGVCYFLWRNPRVKEIAKSLTGECRVTVMSGDTAVSTSVRKLNEHDVFIRHGQAVSILNKVRAANEPTVDSWVSRQKPFGFRTFFSAFKRREFPGAVRIYARGEQGWISRDKVVVHPDWVDQWKVLTPRAAEGKGDYPNRVTAQPVVAGPGSCCTETYLVAGRFASEPEAVNYAAYMRTRFFRFLVSLRKNTQDLNQARFSFVPQLDMSRCWTDEDLYARYGLTADEVAFIESQVKAMP